MQLFKPEKFLILVVDDVALNLQIIAKTLDKVGYNYTFASNGYQALKCVRSVRPDLILLDLIMPEMDGLEVCEKIQSDPELEEIPIIFISASQNQDHLLQAFEKGAVDYVTKPFHASELLARVRMHLELKYSQQKLKELLQAQEELVRNLEKLANTDPLTGVWNRRYLLTKAEQEISRIQRYNNYLSVLLIDIDNFKKVNDSFGHSIGDEVIIFMTKMVLNYLRQVDCFGRFGGEEFVVLLPETDIDEAVIVAERIRENICNQRIPVLEEQLSITVSIGVANYNLGDQSIDTIIQRADEALYRAKNQGRNRTIAYH
ncbi:diguanylate cyclase [Anabaena cylindrica FACHB-243]|uniref:Response regulator receiver modulated diguanylate cyclase n=1 Tax=Anabaena cylindrica (strain ATCC 27899 / PCC 7122) TaxID=272123 RepID=K9ZHJ6_ANACC|nr:MULTISPECIES: diguanylate cyclase [Anabaena]AFZ58666.1 response regulator receiver modulated diguanylate cyclase [Anabaena cylindrica PCC 7122]MBD2420010.1 diguanylate cyclase [Anabaena cylindrica FACHB-243]MBY5283019.1 diguanylate cyclase [Anabaena sp. CCAP 1446/1C]MBY5306482.1 diguanylate cyclase [Anabaena sp. CCAP 1446/1C]MCM2407095.1 diguanylate cyclase [Anabaena sp. CCAP 1446/1C]